MFSSTERETDKTQDWVIFKDVHIEFFYFITPSYPLCALSFFLRLSIKSEIMAKWGDGDLLLVLV